MFGTSDFFHSQYIVLHVAYGQKVCPIVTGKILPSEHVEFTTGLKKKMVRFRVLK